MATKANKSTFRDLRRQKAVSAKTPGAKHVGGPHGGGLFVKGKPKKATKAKKAAPKKNTFHPSPAYQRGQALKKSLKGRRNR